MNVITELLADKRKLEEIRKLCFSIRFQNTLARKIIQDFFSEAAPVPVGDNSQNK